MVVESAATRADQKVAWKAAQMALKKVEMMDISMVASMASY